MFSQVPFYLLFIFNQFVDRCREISNEANSMVCFFVKYHSRSHLELAGKRVALILIYEVQSRAPILEGSSNLDRQKCIRQIVLHSEINGVSTPTLLS